MEEKIAVRSMLEIILSCSLVMSFSPQLVRAVSTSIYVDDSNTAGPWDGTIKFPYENITSALQAATGNDTIYVFDGTYHESLLINNTEVSIVGQSKDGVIIDGGGAVYGVHVYEAFNVDLERLTIQNSWCGLGIESSDGVRMREVSMTGNVYNFQFGEATSEFVLTEPHWDYNIDSSNTVDGKSIYVWVDRQNAQVPTDAGYVGLIDCRGIVMQGLNLSKNFEGISLVNVNDSLVENVRISDTQMAVLELGSNNTIRSNLLVNNSAGIYLDFSIGCNVADNIVTNTSSFDGIYVEGRNNTIARNTIDNNTDGIMLYAGDNNLIVGNNIAFNRDGISLTWQANNNLFYHNNVINDEYPVDFAPGGIPRNSWDDGYPSGGNYWSMFNRTDSYHGTYQNETGSDGIGDTPVLIGYDADHYPLMSPYNPPIYASIDIPHEAVNLEIKSNWITGNIELLIGAEVADINVSTVMINGTIPAELTPILIGDHDSDTVPDLTVRFNRTALVHYILSQGLQYGNLTLTVSGQLNDEEANAPFEGSVIVRVSALPGDVDCDGKVGVQDLVLVVSAYGSHPDEPRWNDNANLAAPWDKIGLTDLVTIALHFGQNVP